MNGNGLLNIIMIFIIPLLIVVLPFFIGQRIGISRSSSTTEKQHASVGAAVGAAFALLAFMLAITFQIVSNRWEARKDLLLEEVTNIRTAYIRSKLLSEPEKTETKALLIEYVNIRYDFAFDIKKLLPMITRSPQIKRILFLNWM